jgi:hypothetical protein
MGIETLQKAALAAGFVMATPDDDPPVEPMFDESDEDMGRRAQGQWLVPLAHAPARRTSPRDQMASAMAWIRHHLPLMGRAPA